MYRVRVEENVGLLGRLSGKKGVCDLVQILAILESKKVGAVQALRPIDRWLSYTWAKQLQEKQDIRKDKTNFAKDIASAAKRAACTFSRTANNNYSNARKIACANACLSSKQSIDLKMINATSWPWASYFTSPSFSQAIQAARLRALPSLLTQWADYRSESVLNRLFNSLRLQERFNPRLLKSNTKRRITPFPRCKIEDTFNLDKAGRKRSKIVTPSNLTATKRRLHRVWSNTPKWFAPETDVWTTLGSWANGRLLPQQNNHSFGAFVDNIFAVFKRKLSD